LHVLDREILEFTSSIGATAPEVGDETHSAFHSIFRRSNYFILKGTSLKPQKFLIVKISRSGGPFWGIGEQFIDLLNEFEINYFLVLLVSPKSGWVFSKHATNANIGNLKWKLREADNNYKINPPLPEDNFFNSPDTFFQRIAHSDI
jgi:hypothetical protein